MYKISTFSKSPIREFFYRKVYQNVVIMYIMQGLDE